MFGADTHINCKAQDFLWQSMVVHGVRFELIVRSYAVVMAAILAE